MEPSHSDREIRQFTSLGERLRAARRRAFVGRSTELGLFRSALRDAAESVAVLFLSGPGGIGKSTLLQRFADEAGVAGRTVVEIVESRRPPTPATFEADAAEVFTRDRAVLLVDDFDAYEPIEDWLRERFLPRLPAGSLVVLAGRRPPGATWSTDPGWEDVLRIVALGDLQRDESVALLTARGVPATLHPAILAFAGGHPLALSLAASEPERAIGEPDEWSPSRDMVGVLLARLVGRVPSPLHRQVLEISAHVRTTTEGLLRAVLQEDADTSALFDWLRRLPFMEPAHSGVRPHRVVRKALSMDLSWRDPQRYEDMHGRLIRHFLDQARAASDSANFADLEELTYLLWHDSGTLVETDRYDAYEDVLRPGDQRVILDITAECTNEETAAIARFWLERRPGEFVVFRSVDSGEPVGFMLELRLTAPDEEENGADPVLAEAWSHVRRESPLREGEHLAVTRFLLAREAFPSPVGNLVAVRLVATAILSEGIGWGCLVMPHVEFWEQFLVFGQQDPVKVPVGDCNFGLFCDNWQEKRPDQAWSELLRQRSMSAPRPVPRHRTVRTYAVLSRAEFDEAVRGALRSWHRPDALADSPLVPTRLVAEAGPDPVEALRTVLHETIERLGADPREVKPYRAITMTFVQNTPTQQVAAERLGLPFSTYRRHLTRGLGRICDLLWQRELQGARENP